MISVLRGCHIFDVECYSIVEYNYEIMYYMILHVITIHAYPTQKYIYIHRCIFTGVLQSIFIFTGVDKSILFFIDDL